jgi:hypothetical protein
MSTLQNGDNTGCRLRELTSLESLLIVAARFSERCYICRWIVANQGSRTDVLNPLPIGGVTITPEAQHRHLLGHGEIVG